METEESSQDGFPDGGLFDPDQTLPYMWGNDPDPTLPFMFEEDPQPIDPPDNQPAGDSDSSSQYSLGDSDSGSDDEMTSSLPSEPWTTRAGRKI